MLKALFLHLIKYFFKILFFWLLVTFKVFLKTVNFVLFLILSNVSFNISLLFLAKSLSIFSNFLILYNLYNLSKKSLFGFLPNLDITFTNFLYITSFLSFNLFKYSLWIVRQKFWIMREFSSHIIFLVILFHFAKYKFNGDNWSYL